MLIVSVSGGKDSIAMLLDQVESGGPDGLLAHYQVMPEDWPETLGYTQAVCRQIGVPLLAQQIVYEPVGAGTGVQRQQIVTIQREADIIPLGTPGVIAGMTDLALRRGWPPSPATRYCTRYFKIELLDTWLRQERRAGRLHAQVALGERAGESPRRAKKSVSADRLKWRDAQIQNWLPIHTWTRRQVFRKMRDWGIAPHPAYAAQGMQPWQMYDEDTEGGPRTACRFCIYASQSDLCHQAQSVAHQELLQRLATVEQVTGRTWWMQGSAVELLEREGATHETPNDY